MLEELIQLDKTFFLYLNGLGTDTWDGFWMYLSKTLSFVTIPIFTLLLLLSYKVYGLKKTGVLLVTIALLITCTDQLSNFFKYGIGRLRPCYDEDVMTVMRLVKGYCGGKYSYFSAHAGNSCALASFFAILLKKNYKSVAFFIIVWALLVGYSRIYIGVHFPLDVMTGLLIGFFFGWLFTKLFLFASLKLRI